MAVRRNFTIALAVLGTVVAFPSAAAAHGPVSPVASSYLARVRSVPTGLTVKVVDADQQMWMRTERTVVVLDYQGAPYLRFTRAGVSVNSHSAMYYLNHNPAELPPSGLSRSTPPDWRQASRSHDYLWHDGRLHALASVATSLRTSFVGTWRIPLVVDGRPTAISGGLWHARDPSLVWFWPIVVVLVCVLAAVRVRKASLDRLLGWTLGLGALAGIGVGGIGRELYGRPTVGAFQLVVVGALIVFMAWALRGTTGGGFFPLLVTAFVALWIGGLLIPTLLHGYVLTAVPAFWSRLACVACLASGPGLILLAFRLPMFQEGPDPTSDRAPSEPGPETRQSVA
jgi:hypothetical protein